MRPKPALKARTWGRPADLIFPGVSSCFSTENPKSLESLNSKQTAMVDQLTFPSPIKRGWIKLLPIFCLKLWIYGKQCTLESKRTKEKHHYSNWTEISAGSTTRLAIFPVLIRSILISCSGLGCGLGIKGRWKYSSNWRRGKRGWQQKYLPLKVIVQIKIPKHIKKF